MSTVMTERHDLAARPEAAQYAIRIAREHELDSIRDIELVAGDLFRDTPYSELLAKGELLPREFLATQQRVGMLWVLVDESDTPVGFGTVHHHIDGRPFLEEISVDPGHGHRGLGAWLLETICDALAEGGAADLSLTTFEDVAWNAPFYAHHGFRALTRDEMRPGLRQRLDLEMQIHGPLRRVAMIRSLS